MTEQDTTACTLEGEEEDGRPDDDHLAGVEDGCGCTEVWEHLSENRADD